MLPSHTIEVRVRYQETDAQGHVHHANYLTYFELARTELLRASGRDYELLEQDGFLLVISEVTCKYYAPARFGDVLQIAITTTRAKGARVHHAYRVTHAAADTLLAEASSVAACVDRAGKVRRLPAWMLESRGDTS